MTENERRVQKLFDIANSHAPDVLDRMQTLVADTMTYSSPITGTADRDAMRGVHAAFFKAFPDYAYSLERTIPHGDTVVVEAVFKGNHKGELMGIAPTNRSVALPLAFVSDFKGGKIQKWSSYFDVASVMRQIGVQP